MAKDSSWQQQVFTHRDLPALQLHFLSLFLLLFLVFTVEVQKVLDALVIEMNVQLLPVACLA